jgi:hypothetical protein
MESKLTYQTAQWQLYPAVVLWMSGRHHQCYSSVLCLKNMDILTLFDGAFKCTRNQLNSEGAMGDSESPQVQKIGYYQTL